MDDQDRTAPASADGVTERDPAIPASEEGTGIIPGDKGHLGGADTHRPASEADTSLIENDEPPPQSWPGKGGPGTFPPPG